MDDRLVAFKNPADIDGNLGFFITVGEFTQVTGFRADADHAPNPQLLKERLLNPCSNLVDLFLCCLGLDGFDNNNIVLIDIQNEIMLPIRK